MKKLDLIGIGIGPFNLSLAALSEKIPSCETLFFDQKAEFDWHSDLLFDDANMQTSYLKDLVTPVDPTNPNSFLNYLVENGLFYAFMNTGRKTISRREFEMYCQWAARRLETRLRFNSPVDRVDFDGSQFLVQTKGQTFASQNICLGTGLRPKVPDCALPYLGAKVFHAKSSQLRHMNLEDKSVLIVGGGQTGLEVFRNTLNGKWGSFKSLRLCSSRPNLQPLDESPFTNEYFTPDYVDTFFDLDQKRKDEIVASQKLASDGNTPAYLSLVFNDLYHRKYVLGDERAIEILPHRHLMGMEHRDDFFALHFENQFNDRFETLAADIVILCTGFSNAIPEVIEPLRNRIEFDSVGRFSLQRGFCVKWSGPSANRIYAVNFSRHCHGIADPQTSLMAWRSASIINDVLQKTHYLKVPSRPIFADFDSSPGSIATWESPHSLSFKGVKTI